MNDMANLLHNLMTIETPMAVELKITPQLTIHVDKALLEQSKSEIVAFCKKLTDDDISSWRQLRRHVGQDDFLAYFLLAIGDKVKVWERFPSPDIEWNLPHWPCAKFIDPK